MGVKVILMMFGNSHVGRIWMDMFVNFTTCQQFISLAKTDHKLKFFKSSKYIRLLFAKTSLYGVAFLKFDYTIYVNKDRGALKIQLILAFYSNFYHSIIQYTLTKTADLI